MKFLDSLEVSIKRLPKCCSTFFFFFLSKVTTPKDAHERLVLQVYLALNALEFSAICMYVGKIFVRRL